MRISDWSSDVCSSDLFEEPGQIEGNGSHQYEQQQNDARVLQLKGPANRRTARPQREQRSAQRQAGQHNACRIGKSIAPNDMFIAPRLGQLECLETQNRKNAGHDIEQQDRKSTRLNSVTNAHLVCSPLLETKKKNPTTLHHQRIK